MSRYSRAALSVTFVLLFELSAQAQSYTISTYAGASLPASGTPAIAQTIGVPNSVVPDGVGGFYFLSVTHSRVYGVTADGTLIVLAGNGTFGFSGDGGAATAAKLTIAYRTLLERPPAAPARSGEPSDGRSHD